MTMCVAAIFPQGNRESLIGERQKRRGEGREEEESKRRYEERGEAVGGRGRGGNRSNIQQ